MAFVERLTLTWPLSIIDICDFLVVFLSTFQKLFSI